uniref:Uncharacterized protein n=1 Tax=Lotharella oceanica TaxID=641309 RepID=A0A7S2TZ27_9EUKA
MHSKRFKGVLQFLVETSVPRGQALEDSILSIRRIFPLCGLPLAAGDSAWLLAYLCEILTTASMNVVRQENMRLTYGATAELHRFQELTWREERERKSSVLKRLRESTEELVEDVSRRVVEMHVRHLDTSIVPNLSLDTDWERQRDHAMETRKPSPCQVYLDLYLQGVHHDLQKTGLSPGLILRTYLAVLLHALGAAIASSAALAPSRSWSRQYRFDIGYMLLALKRRIAACVVGAVVGDKAKRCLMEIQAQWLKLGVLLSVTCAPALEVAAMCHLANDSHGSGNAQTRRHSEEVLKAASKMSSIDDCYSHAAQHTPVFFNLEAKDGKEEEEEQEESVHSYLARDLSQDMKVLAAPRMYESLGLRALLPVAFARVLPGKVALVSPAELAAFVATRNDLKPDYPALEGEALAHAEVLRKCFKYKK